MPFKWEKDSDFDTPGHLNNGDIDLILSAPDAYTLCVGFVTRQDEGGYTITALDSVRGIEALSHKPVPLRQAMRTLMAYVQAHEE